MPLSYLIYTHPHERPFSDVDLFIRKEDFKVVRRMMSDLGYEMPNAVHGDHIAYQQSFEKRDPFGVEHVYDFHWKISNPLVFSDLFLFEEALSDSVGVPRLGERARTLCLEKAFVLACVHRVAHHAGEQRPIWLRDIQLLIDHMGPERRRAAAKLAKDKKVSAICRQGLLDAGMAAEDFTPAAPELSAAYLTPENPRLRDLYFNLRSLPGFRGKLKYLREITLPPADYMMKKYSLRHPAYLPFYYVYRGLSGFAKWLFFR